PRWIRRERRVAAVADDFGRNTLANLALATWIDQQRVVRMRVNVDEPRRQRQAGQVAARASLRAGKRSTFWLDRRDPRALNGNVTRKCGCAGAIEDLSIAKYQVEHGVPPPLE